MEHRLTVEDDKALVTLSGRFTHADHGHFYRLLIQLGSLPRHMLLDIDLGQLAFIDSAAIGMLVVAHEESQAKGQRMRLRHPRAQVRMAFDIAHVDRMVEVVE